MKDVMADQRQRASSLRNRKLVILSRQLGFGNKKNSDGDDYTVQLVTHTNFPL